MGNLGWAGAMMLAATSLNSLADVEFFIKAPLKSTLPLSQSEIKDQWRVWFNQNCGMSFSDIAQMESFIDYIPCTGVISEMPNSSSGLFVPGQLIIGSSSLTSISSLKQSANIANIHISNNDNILSLDGLQSLVNPESVSIGYNQHISDIDELSNMVSAGRISIEDAAITNLNGFVNLSTVTTDLTIINIQIQNLLGLSSLTSSPEVTITGNSQLTTLDGLQSLTASQYLGFYENPLLDDLSALNSFPAQGAQVSVVLDDRNYSIKLDANSAICLGFGTNFVVYGPSKAEICNL